MLSNLLFQYLSKKQIFNDNINYYYNEQIKNQKAITNNISHTISNHTAKQLIVLFKTDKESKKKLPTKQNKDIYVDTKHTNLINDTFIDVLSITIGRQIGRYISIIDSQIITGYNNGILINRFTVIKETSYNMSLLILGHLILWAGDRIVIESLSIIPMLTSYKKELIQISIGIRGSYMLYKSGNKIISETTNINKVKTLGWELSRIMFALAENGFLYDIEYNIYIKHEWFSSTLKVILFNYYYNKVKNIFWYSTTYIHNLFIF
jgi:hypothetical protein